MIKKFLYKIWSEFLTQLGKIKVLTFSFFPILAYDPDPYYVTGYDLEKIMNLVRPGDIILRGYNKYLDSKFIPDAKGYSHAGIYVGKNEMVHAVAPCVEKTHILDFCQADRIMVLHPKGGYVGALTHAAEQVGVPYDFDYKSDKGKLYCFELVSDCYPMANMQTFVVKKFMGLVKRKCYLAKSLYENPWFELMFERNAKIVNTK